MGEEIAVKEILRRITGKEPEERQLSREPDLYGLSYHADGLCAMVQNGGGEVLVFYEGLNLSQYPHQEIIIASTLTEANTEWGTPNENPRRVCLHRHWPDYNREVAHPMGRSSVNGNGLEQKAQSVYFVGKGLLEKLPKK